MTKGTCFIGGGGGANLLHLVLFVPSLEVDSSTNASILRFHEHGLRSFTIAYFSVLCILERCSNEKEL